MEPRDPHPPVAVPGLPPELGIPAARAPASAAATPLAPIDAASALLASSVEGADAAPARYGFEVAGLPLLLPKDVPSELVEMPTPSALPNTRVWLRGLVNLRGNLVPVYDLVRLLATEGDGAAEDGSSNRGATVVPLRRPVLLVLGAGESMAGLALDRLPRALDALALEERPVPQSLHALIGPHVTHVLHDGTQGWLEFDPDSLFMGLRSLVESR